MAIMQSALSEDIFTRQEKSVIRGIYRASQILSALVDLNKIEDGFKCTTGIDGILHSVCSPAVQDAVKTQTGLMKKYLVGQLSDALVSTKVPKISEPTGNIIAEKTQ